MFVQMLVSLLLIIGKLLLPVLDFKLKDSLVRALEIKVKITQYTANSLGLQLHKFMLTLMYWRQRSVAPHNQ